MANPIRKVDGKDCPCPASLTWTCEDVSNAEAGRTEDGLMHKNTIRAVRSLELAWNYITTEEVQSILSVFKGEYHTVEYLDPEVGGYTTKTFYVGNRSSPMYNAEIDLWENISFNIIER